VLVNAALYGFVGILFGVSLAATIKPVQNGAAFFDTSLFRGVVSRV
jgi:hypothetical protein